MLVEYDQVVDIPIKSLVHFKEYELDRHENKKLRIQVDGELATIIKPEEKLNKDLIEVYYRGLSPESYPMVSSHPFIRLVLIVGSDRMGVPIYRVVSLNKYYMSVALQTLEYEKQVITQPTVPAQILGFGTYDVGKKFI